MALVPRTGTITYSGITTTTDTDVLTLSGWDNSSGGRIEYLLVKNRDGVADILYVRTDSTTATAAAGDGVVVVKPGMTLEVPIEPTGKVAGGVVVKLVSGAACDYTVTAHRAAR